MLEAFRLGESICDWLQWPICVVESLWFRKKVSALAARFAKTFASLALKQPMPKLNKRLSQ